MNVLLNLYLKDKSNLFQSEVISFNRKIKTLDDARILIIKYLGNNYSSCKYNINIYNSFDGTESSINIIFGKKQSMSIYFINIIPFNFNSSSCQNF